MTTIYIYIYIYGKISGKWIDQTLTTGLMVIFRSLLTEELHQTKHFFAFFYILIENVKRYIPDEIRYTWCHLITRSQSKSN